MTGSQAAQAVAPVSGWTTYVPALNLLTSYQRTWLRKDVIAALAVWALVVPQAIAYAQIAGLPPEAGLFTAFAGLLVYGLLGTSRQLVVSPTSSTAAISASLVAPLAAGDASDYAALSATLAMLMGVVLIVLGLLKMGFVSRFIPEAVTIGFMFGLGLTIIAGQLPKLLGLPGESDGDFIPQVENLVSNLGEINEWTAVIGLSSLGAVLVLGRRMPAIPAALVVVLAGIALVAIFDLTDHGVAVIGDVDGAFPTPEVPSVDWADITALLPGALAIGIIGYAESATVAETMADEHDYQVRPSQELSAIGAANIFSGLFQGFLTGGGASQSAANDRAGAQTQLASILVAGLTLVTAVALLPLFEDLPEAALGAIVIGAVIGFLNVPALRRLAGLRRDSFLLALTAMAGVLLLGVLPGLVVAIAIAMIGLLMHLARPGTSLLGRLPDGAAYLPMGPDSVARPVPGLVVYRLDAPMMFTNAKRVRSDVQDQIRSAPEPVRIVLLDLSFSANLDVTSLDVLAGLERELKGQGIQLWLAGVDPRVQRMLELSGLTAHLAPEHVYRSVDDAARDLEEALASPEGTTATTRGSG